MDIILGDDGTPKLEIKKLRHGHLEKEMLEYLPLVFGFIG